MKNREETIRIENLSTGYISKRKRAIITEGVNASLYSGELTCLLGPNGAGKSTLLKTLSGFLPPVAGDIIIEGKKLSDYTAAQLAKVIGVVLTERINLNNMSVRDLIAMGRSPYTGFWGHLGKEDSLIIDEAISLVNIENLSHRMIQTLSDGERQKVMIAKALAQETPIIFLDEPTAFLDYPSKVEIMQLLQNLSRIKRKTVFLSTHDLELALQIADKAWLIDKKFGLTAGTPEDLALSGMPGKYFEREGVVFDLDSGLFRIDYKHQRHLRVEGDSRSCTLLSKALARNGIGISSEGSDENLILATPGCYKFRGKEYASIEDLLNAIL